MVKLRPIKILGSLSLGLLALTSCSQADPAAERAATAASMDAALAELAELKELNAEVAKLKRDLDRSERRRRPAAVVSAPKFRAPVAARGMCYKDYCPCHRPQEGMDSLICDQLEAGIDVPLETMIAGRGGREYRRQAAEIGF